MYALIRILGNDLPPRHTDGQTFENLKYILDNENDFEFCDKFFVLNKIVDPEKRKNLITLLDSYGASWWEEHIDWASFEVNPLKTLIGLNQIRNKVIRKYLDKKYEVVLPLDGNCFFTPTSWSHFEKVSYHSPNDGYFALPMQRCVSYADLQGDVNFFEAWLSRDSNGRPARKLMMTEPQLAFTPLSDKLFDENYEYATASKAHLLWKLGLPGIWDEWYPEQRAACRNDPSKHFGKTRYSGWIYRLPSGIIDAEIDNAIRGNLRQQGIQNLILSARRFNE